MSRKTTALHDRLRVEVSGTDREKLRAAAQSDLGTLVAGLRNVNRTTTQALDMAGVPDRLQGEGPADWDTNDEEEWGH